MQKRPQASHLSSSKKIKDLQQRLHSALETKNNDEVTLKRMKEKLITMQRGRLTLSCYPFKAAGSSSEKDKREKQLRKSINQLEADLAFSTSRVDCISHRLKQIAQTNKSVLKERKRLYIKQAKKNNRTRKDLICTSTCSNRGSDEKQVDKNTDNNSTSTSSISIIAGNFHQGDITVFHSDTAGKQCVANCLVSLTQAKTKAMSSWNQSDLDCILLAGDVIYRELRSTHDFLLLDDIPKQITVMGKNWEVNMDMEFQSTINKVRIKNLLDAHLNLHEMAIAMLGDVTCASALSLNHTEEGVFVFDPHSRSHISGLQEEDGHSICARFPTIDGLVTYIMTLARQLSSQIFSMANIHLRHETNVQKNKQQWNVTNTESKTNLPGDILFATKKKQNTYVEPICISPQETLSNKQLNTDTRQMLVCQICQRSMDNMHNLKRHKVKCQRTRCEEKERIRHYTRQSRKRKQQLTEHSPCKVQKKDNQDERQKKNTLNRRKARQSPEKRKRDNDKLKHARHEKGVKQQMKNNDKWKENLRKHERRSDAVYIQEQHHQRQTKRFGSCFRESVKIFLESTRHGPIYICTCCQQTMFRDDVEDINQLRPGNHGDLLKRCQTNYISVDGKEWLCSPCKRDIYQDLCPKMAIINKAGFPKQPDALQLHPLEETLVSPLLPFMRIQSLPVGGLTAEGQKKIIGNVVHVPNDIASTVNTLPRQLDNMGTIMLKLKRKLEYKTAVFQAVIRPQKCIEALSYLKQHSLHYQHIMCDVDWFESISASDNVNRIFVDSISTEHDLDKETVSSSLDNNNDAIQDIGKNSDEEDFEEVSASVQVHGNTDTILDEHNPMRVYQDAETELCETETPSQHQTRQRVFNVAPGEGQIPVFRDEAAEYKCFPTIFCGGERPTNDERERPVSTATLFKAELRNIDPRVSLNIPNIFWKATHLKIKQVLSCCHLALRRIFGAKDKKITAGDLLNQETRDSIRRLDEGYRIFRSIRHSPSYFEQKKRELNSMIRQLGYPSYFYSLSAADTHWVDLIRCLGKLVNQEDMSDDYISNEMTFADKCRLVAAHPAACVRYFHHRVQKFMQLIVLGPHSPFGEITDFFFRVEFQKRGSPHIHGFLWKNGAPNIHTASNDDICTEVDKIISCSSDVKQEELPYLKLQIHSHSKTCKRMLKNKAVCRFGAPWPPMRKTQILEPLSEDESLCLAELQEKYKDTMKKLQKLPETVKTFDDWLNLLKMDEVEYVQLVRSTLQRKKLFLQRRPTETRVNAYIKGVLDVWKANHDIQYVLHPFHCVSYICDYMTKSQKGMSDLMQAATDEARSGNMDVKNSVRHIAGKFINAAESSVQQCCMDILSLPVTNSSRKKEYINTNPPAERIGLAKSMESLKELDPKSKSVTMLSNIDRYAMRPKMLESWCLADYVAKTDIEYPKKHDKQTFDFEDIDPESLQIHEGDEAFINTDGFPYVLKNGQLIKRRRHNKIIRFRRYNQKTDAENFYREMLLLYTPWRNEKHIMSGYNTYEEAYKKNKQQINCRRVEFEPFAEELDLAYEEFYAQQLTDKDASGDDDNADISEVEDSGLPVLQPDRDSQLFRVDLGAALGIPPTQGEQDSVEQSPIKLTDEQYFGLLESLNTRQEEFRNHLIHKILYSNEQQLLVLHGGAGTGKSTVIKTLSESLNRIMCRIPGRDFDGCSYLLMAPTGKAAYNIRGQTIHRALKVPASQKLEYKKLTCDMLNTVRSNFHGKHWIIIDEFSMVGKRMLDFINLRLQEICGNQKNFGGMNILLVGDLFQLKPVKDSWIFQESGGPYDVLTGNLFKDNFEVFELTEIMRQKEDQLFAEILNRIRCGKQTSQDIQQLQSRHTTYENSIKLSHVPHFFTTNAKKDAYNTEIMRRSCGRSLVIQAIDTPPSDIPKSEQRKAVAAAEKIPISSTGNLPFLLEVKEDVCYDVTANISPEEGIVNGAECTVRCIGDITSDNLPLCVWVEFTDKNIGIETRKKVGRQYKPYIDKNWTPIQPIRRTFIATRSNYTMTRVQFPLHMSAGRTIHKAQSATHKEVVVDLSGPDAAPKIFYEHIHYVALSRCTKLSGLHIVDINEPRICVSSKVLQYLENDKKELQLRYTPVYNSSHNLALSFNNVGSIQNKWNIIRENKNITSTDIIVLAETWLTPAHPQNMFQINGYQYIRMDSKHQIGHRGMMMFIKDALLVTTTHKFQSKTCEILSCVVSNGSKTWNVVGFYRPPSSSRRCFMEDLGKALIHLDLSLPTILAGDINIDFNSDDSYSLGQHMKQKYDMEQVVTEATTWDGTLIDVIFTNFSQVSTYTIGNVWSKHNVLFAMCTEV